MSYFKSIMLAGAVAVSGMFTATNADALGFTLSGQFVFEAYNYDLKLTESEATRSAKSQATASNFSALGTDLTFANNVLFDMFTYNGPLDFRIGTPGGTGTTTVADFLKTGTGSLVDVIGLDPTFGSRVNSAGGGGNDGGVSTPFTTATLYKITATSLNIGSLAQINSITHDDGVTLLGASGSNYTSVGPNSEITKNNLATVLSGNFSNFTLFYASANGDPSILEATAVPLPAAAWLLLGVAGALVAAKRRSSLRAA